MQLTQPKSKQWLEWDDIALDCTRLARTSKLMGKPGCYTRQLEKAAEYAKRECNIIERGFEL